MKKVKQLLKVNNKVYKQKISIFNYEKRGISFFSNFDIFV